MALVWQAEGVWLFLGPQFNESAPIVQVLFAAVAFRALTKLGDANMRALDGLTAGIAIKVVFLAAIAGGVWWNLDQDMAPWALQRRGPGLRASMVAHRGVDVGSAEIAVVPLLRALQGGLFLSVVVVAPMAMLLDMVGRICPVCWAGDGHPCVVSRPQLAQALDQQGDLRRQVAAKLPNSNLRRRWMH